MDHEQFIQSVSGIAAILSVDLSLEKDQIKTVAANDAYKRTVVSSPELFEANVPYTKYIKQDSNFEELCRKCSSTHRPLHTYVDAAYFNAWLDVFFLPLQSDKDGIDYILFSYEMTPKADADKLLDISPDTALSVLKTCIRLRETNDFALAMDSIVEDLRVLCGATGCCILLTDFNKKTCSLLGVDMNTKKANPEIHSFFGQDFYPIAETWPRLVDGSNSFIIHNDKDMETVREKSPDWYASLTDKGVKNLVIYPLRSSDETIGYIWANDFDPNKTLVISEVLEITTFILSAEIANHQMIRQMQILSSTDLLTGVKNRNAMNNRILDNDSGVSVIQKPFGAIFVDVNGLKTTNDTKGHQAGDALLKDVAHSLTEFCPDYEVYRVGGDEFLVIAPDLEKEGFDALDATLHANSERKDRAHFAVGSCHSSEVNDNIRKAMQMADARMYENKEEYYERHPEYAWDRRIVAINHENQKP